VSKHLKVGLILARNGIIGAIVIVIGTTAISFPLLEQGIITIHEVSGYSTIWVNWELHLIFSSVFALVTWLTYRFALPKKWKQKREVKNEVSNSSG